MNTPPLDGSHLASHDVIFEGSLPDWTSGMLLGGGDNAVVAYQRGSQLCYGTSRSGFVDTRNAIQIAPDMTHARVEALWKERRFDELGQWDRDENAHYHKYPYPMQRPVGVLSLTPVADSAGAEPARHVLSLRDALLTQSTPALDVALCVAREADVIALSVLASGPLLLAFTAIVDYAGKGSHWWDATGDIDSEIDWQVTPLTDGFSARVALPDGRVAAVECRLNNADASTQAGGLIVTPQGDKRIEIFVAIKLNVDCEDFAQQAVEGASNAASSGWAAGLDAHRRDWRRFWSVNCLVIEDRFLEQLFYLEQYLLRCQLGGAHVFSMSSAWLLGSQPWHGDMHVNINVEMAYLPIFGLGHPELLRSCADHFTATLEYVEQETRRFYGRDGLSYPFASAGNLKPLHGGLWRYEIYCSAWVSQLFWEHYRFTRDIDHLRRVAYPVMKGVLIWYASLLVLGDDGLYHMPMSKPVENQRPPDGSPFVADTLLDLAVLRQSLSAAIEAADILGVDKDLRCQWQEKLDRLAPLPRDSQAGMFVAFEGADPNLPNDHPTLLGALYPSGLAMSSEERALADGAFARLFGASNRTSPIAPFTKIMSWGDDLSYSWLMIAAARLGKRDIVHAYLYDLLILLQLKRNGLFATKPCDISERDSKISIFNTVGGFTQGLTEMFLQSYDGLLRVFPATPNGYTSAFAGLKAAGNVSVSASQVDGRLCRIHLVAGSAGLIRLRNDWGAVRITLPDSNVVTVVDEIIELPAKPDDVFVIEPVESRPKFALSWETASPERPRTWSGPQYLERVPKDQEWTVTIGQRSLL